MAKPARWLPYYPYIDVYICSLEQKLFGSAEAQKAHDGHLDGEAEGTSTQTDVVLRKFVSATHALRVRDFAAGRKRRVSVRLTTQPVLLERLCFKADTHLLPLAPHVFLCMSFYMFR